MAMEEELGSRGPLSILRAPASPKEVVQPLARSCDHWATQVEDQDNLTSHVCAVVPIRVLGLLNQ